MRKSNRAAEKLVLNELSVVHFNVQSIHLLSLSNLKLPTDAETYGLNFFFSQSMSSIWLKNGRAALLIVLRTIIPCFCHLQLSRLVWSFQTGHWAQISEEVPCLLVFTSLKVKCKYPNKSSSCSIDFFYSISFQGPSLLERILFTLTCFQSA